MTRDSFMLALALRGPTISDRPWDPMGWPLPAGEVADIRDFGRLINATHSFGLQS